MAVDSFFPPPYLSSHKKSHKPLTVICQQFKQVSCLWQQWQRKLLAGKVRKRVFKRKWLGQCRGPNYGMLENSVLCCPTTSGGRSVYSCFPMNTLQTGVKSRPFGREANVAMAAYAFSQFLLEDVWQALLTLALERYFSQHLCLIILVVTLKLKRNITSNSSVFYLNSPVVCNGQGA